MDTPITAETPLMRSNANRLRHAMTQLHKTAEQVQNQYHQWADAVRETAAARVGSAETDDVLADPIYDRALEASPEELCRVVQQWCTQMTSELDAWRPVTPARTAGQASRADLDTRRAGATEAVPDLDATDSASGGGGQT